ncbi:hypothetical protein K435DRAFT_859147 [Dendrothele bispora CBS 962.96]|uniref:Uncharacterized protein n=1 Tax=Dendrothele bispora (strain CBS 962.96) TaxID=1314807 RepID=A0A4S8M155_DENBC|nr:hypothetical protein K435DRAFT_859147 [Dendrothele bispora CBS 962.96]
MPRHQQQEQSCSPSPQPSERGDEESKVIVVQLTVYTKNPSTKKRGRPSFTKEIKTKDIEHVFADSKDNYVQFLTAMLERHSKSKLISVTENRLYPFKLQIPPTNKGAASDIDNFDDFCRAVKKIEDMSAGKTLTALLDEKVIKDAAKKDASDNDSQSGDDVNSLLEKKYGNPEDNACFYICPKTRESVPLTPQMMSEWARAIADGKTTELMPPETVTFDPATRRSSLGHHRRYSSASADGGVPQAPTSDIAHLARILDRFTPVPPMSPVHKTADIEADDTFDNPPTKLPRFLHHASTQLGITNAEQYETVLRANAYGPDILHLNAPKWIKSAAARPTLGDSSVRADIGTNRDANGGGDSSTNGDGSEGAKTSELIRFERRYLIDGGGKNCFAQGIRFQEKGLPPDSMEKPEIDRFEWWFYSADLRSMVPVPKGYEPYPIEDDM